MIIINTYMPSYGSSDHKNKYQEMLDQIFEIRQKYCNSSMVWMGDLNGSLVRSNNHHDTMLKESIRELGIKPPTNLESATYHHFSHSVKSQIDYILCDPKTVKLCTDHRVLERQSRNTSTHDPVQAKFKIRLQKRTKKKETIDAAPMRIQWHRAYLTQYFDETEQHFGDLRTRAPHMAPDTIIEELETVLQNAGMRGSGNRKVDQQTLKT